uniref:Uncharacterized protein n=1 Tax=Pelusios castaneus TaxID=367368 RepID=A0A8C8SVM9_9SAUR
MRPAKAHAICLSPADWQVSQQLQQASRAHVAESSHLSQQVSAKEETLGQRVSELERAQSQLEQARQELEQTWLEGNKTQEQSRQQALKLEGTQADLARVQQELRETEEKLNQTETALSNIRPCEQTDCCPENWLLYSGKCLFVSKEKKSWDKSKEDCEGKRAQLLITKSWDSRTMPVQYTCGAVNAARTLRTEGRLHVGRGWQVGELRKQQRQ